MQCNLTINLLCTSSLDPTKSAFEVLEDKFDYNRTSICPPGTKALVYVDPKSRATWAPHALDGWYIVPAMQHYRCGRYWIPETRGICIVNSTKIFPTH